MRKNSEKKSIYKFQSDWFSYYIPLWEKTLGHLKGKPKLHFLEIGTFEGRSTIWLLENILTHPTSRITCVDTFQGSMEDKKLGVDSSKLEKTFKENIKIGNFDKKTKIMKGESRKMLKKLPEGEFDFIYIDGSHVAADVLTDAVLSFCLLKKRGLLCFDDYHWEENPNHLYRPKMAIEAFLKIFREQYELIHRDEQVIVRSVRKIAG